MIRLGKTKKALLKAAVGRGDGVLLPAPDGMSSTSALCRRALGGLLKDGLAEERPAGEGDVTWREEDGARFAIFATAAGFGAVGATPPAAGPGSAEGTLATRPGGKLGTVLDAVGGEDGASLDDLVAVTGWQPHTTRAVISRLRQRGFDIRLAEAGARRVYRLASGT